MLLKKTVYDKLVNNVYAIDTSGFVSKTQYKSDNSDLENKISETDNKSPYPILVDLLKISL